MRKVVIASNWNLTDERTIYQIGVESAGLGLVLVDAWNCYPRKEQKGVVLHSNLVLFIHSAYFY